VRPVRLGRAAAQAEWLRVRLMLRRTAVRGALFAAAVVFLLAAIAAGHVATWIALRPLLSPLWATACIGGGDLVLAILLLSLASRDVPSAAELEAAQMSRAARGALAREFMLFGLMRSLMSLLRRRK
jgi:hypothetical protein